MSIQTMRNRSQGILAKVIVGLIIVVFALFGMGSITTFLTPTLKVATVNGEDITQQEMEIQVERQRRILLAQNQELSSIDEDKLRHDALESLIERKLLSMTADDLGLRLSDINIDAEIIATSAFQIDGEYNPEQFQLVIGSVGYTPNSYRDEIRRDKLLQQISAGIVDSAFLTDAEVKRVNSLSGQTRDIAYIQLIAESLKQEVAVTDEKVLEYYQNNSDHFMTEETVDIAYLEIQRSNLLNDVVVTEEDLQIFFADTRDLYAKAERRRFAHILIAINDEVSTATAKARVEAIYAEILQGKNFSELAKVHSQDPGSAEAGGDLGFNLKGIFVQKFEDAGYLLAVDQVSEPILTEFGYHLIKLLDIEVATTPAYDEVKDQVEKAYREAEAEELFVNLSSKLGEISYESPDLEEPALALDLEVKTTGPVSRNMTTGIAANAAVIEAAFSAEVLVDGNNSLLIEITPNHHLVVRVNFHQPKKLKSFDSIGAAAKEQLLTKAATQLAEERALDMVSLLESGSLTRFVADKYQLEWNVVAAVTRNQVGLDPQINQQAFSLSRPSEDSKTVGYTILDNGDAVVISITNVNNKSLTEAAEIGQKNFANLLSNYQGRHDYDEFRDNLNAQSNISTNQ